MQYVPQKASLRAYLNAAERMRKELNILLEEGHNLAKGRKGLGMRNALDLEIDRRKVHRKAHAKQSRINEFLIKSDLICWGFSFSSNSGKPQKYN